MGVSHFVRVIYVLSKSCPQAHGCLQLALDGKEPPTVMPTGAWVSLAELTLDFDKLSHAHRRMDVSSME